MDPLATNRMPPAVAETPADPRPRSTEEAARQFESLLIAQMLRSARESSSTRLDEDSEESGQSGTMMDLAEQQFAKVLAQNGGLGLTRLMVQGLEPKPAQDTITKSGPLDNGGAASGH